MIRRLLAVTVVLGAALSVATPAGASHSCAEGIPCYPHLCVDPKQHPSTWLC